jgi:hypothetical protein
MAKLGEIRIRDDGLIGSLVIDAAGPGACSETIVTKGSSQAWPNSSLSPR